MLIRKTQSTYSNSMELIRENCNTVDNKMTFIQTIFRKSNKMQLFRLYMKDLLKSVIFIYKILLGGKLASELALVLKEKHKNTGANCL